jgi:rifampicin phosphotransferase
LTPEAPTTTALQPPGPGPWELDPVHFPRPVTRYFAETHPEPFERGFADMTRFYGVLLETRRAAYVDGFAYSQMTPVGESEVPARLQRAEEVFAGKLWREQVREWDESAKPAALAAHRELQSVDTDALSRSELAAHLARCRDHHQRMIAQHMRFTGAALIPTGDFLVHAGEWTAVPPSELLGLLRGAAPISAGASSQLDRLIAAFSADAEARELLESDADAGAILTSLRERDGETGEAVSGYLDLIGYRLLDGFDIAEHYALELPESLVQAIRVAIDTGGAQDGGEDPASRLAEIRERVPETHRAEFDELLGEARFTYRIRDERGVYSDVWASGIMRRAVLGAGRRLAGAGTLPDPELLVDATVDEMQALLSGSGGPDADELAARREHRMSRTARDAPRHLGDPPPPPPDPSGLPPAAARLARAIGVAIGSLFAGSEAPHEERVIRGLSASPGVYEGPARRVSDRAEFRRIAQGDVLVTETTTEAFNILLPLLGAIVTDSGGLLSHAAIVAREYGIPGVVGTRDATQLVPDGVRVRVDGAAGEVTLLA